MRRTILGVAILFAAACGGEKASASDTSTAVTPEPRPDTTPVAAPPADSALPTAKAGSAATPMPTRDSAFGPKFTTDSSGKLVPIKRP